MRWRARLLSSRIPAGSALGYPARFLTVVVLGYDSGRGSGSEAANRSMKSIGAEQNTSISFWTSAMSNDF